MKGALPKELRGVFLRIGPNPAFSPLGGYHWFDGEQLWRWSLSVSSCGKSRGQRTVQYTTAWECAGMRFPAAAAAAAANRWAWYAAFPRSSDCIPNIPTVLPWSALHIPPPPGDGMLHAARLKEGKAAYANHWVRTSRYKQEAAAGWPLFAKVCMGVCEEEQGRAELQDEVTLQGQIQLHVAGHSHRPA